MSDDQFAPYEWERALSASVAAHAARQAARRNERQEFARRRDRGLVRRYAEKTARMRSDDVSNECHSPTNQQVTAPSPVGQTGTDSHPTVAVATDDPRSNP